MRLAPFTVAAIACSDPVTAPRLTSEPVEAPAVVAREAPPAPPDDGLMPVLVVPEGWRASEHLVRTRQYPETLAEGYETTLVDVLHPRPLVRARLRGMLRAWLLGLGTPDEPFLFATCEATFASEPLVSLSCQWSPQESRGSGSTFVTSASYRIEGDDVVPFDIGDAILDGDERQRLATEHCVAHTPVPDHERDDVAGWRERLRREDCGQRWVESVERGGIRLESWWEGHQLFRLPFSALASKIRGDGPLGVLSELGAGVTTERVPRPASEEAAPSTQRWAVSRIAPLEELLGAWMTLAPADRARIELARLDSGAFRLVLEGEEQAVAARIATQLGVTAERVGLETAPLELAFVRAAREELHLRVMPNGWDDSAVLRLLPVGARLAAVLGQIENAESVVGRTRRYTRVVSNERESGWIASRYVELDDGCMPDAGAFVARLPERERAAARVLSGVVRVRRAGQSRDALLFVAATDRESFVSLFERSEDGCTPGALIREVRTPGAWLRIGVPGTTANGGDSLIAVVTDTDQGTRTAVFSLRQARDPIWSMDHNSRFAWDQIAFGRTGARYCPLAFGDACFTWQAGALIEAPEGAPVEDE